MDKLWAPWRIQYVQAAKTKSCIFCLKPKQKKDKKNYIVERKHYLYSLLNIYPYNNGHIMIAPYRHVGDLDQLTDKEQTEMMTFITATTGKLKKVLKTHGFNIGFNIGKAAGAGYESHIHVHIVPRWTGDTNFMPVISDAKVISQSLEDLYRMLTS